MPRFNRSVAVTPKIGFSWYDQERLIYQDCSTGVCHIVLSDDTSIKKDVEVHQLYGSGAGHWVARITENKKNHRVIDWLGREFLDSGLGPMGPDGNYSLKLLYHSYGPWDVIEPDNSRWRLTDGDVSGEAQLLGGRRVMWQEGGSGIVRANFLIFENPGVPVWGARVADDGTLLYQSQVDGSLILAGHVIAPPSDKYFSPDVLLLDGVYHVCWSPSQNDTNAQFLRFTQERLAVLPLAPTVSTHNDAPHNDIPHNDEVNVFKPIRLPDEAQEIVEALYQRYRMLSFGTEAQRQELTEMIAQQLRFSLGPEWGWKQASPSRPPSKDSVSKREGNLLHGWDLFNGTTRAPYDHPMSTDISDQVFIEVEPTDHLRLVPHNDVHNDAPHNDTPDIPLATLAKIMRRLDALEADRLVSLHTWDGHVIVAEAGGGGDVNATRDSVGPWETFVMKSVK